MLCRATLHHVLFERFYLGHRFAVRRATFGGIRADSAGLEGIRNRRESVGLDFGVTASRQEAKSTDCETC